MSSRLFGTERTGNLVDGHQRLKILLEQGHTEIEVSVVNLDEVREKALNIALNKISGRWDEEKLAILLQELVESESSIELTGFDGEELEDLISALPADTEPGEPVVDDEYDVQVALDAIKEPETRHGDIWRLGRHLLVCGDAARLEDVQRLMQGKKANLVVTDPPYNVAVESDSERLAADSRDSILNDNMSDEDFVVFLNQIFANYAAIMKPNAAIYIFHPSSYQREFENAMNAAGIVTRSQCIWVKNAPTFG
ncbi:DNA methylase [Aneurinibacillus thermoaerophilus]|uniref:DNA methylase n=1 Tax=Aneurinibacillus thermoaerophilus TaxID=143495 RepID=A0A1G8DXG6_ANETH|nr:DNA methyltransferase [Aneurinibacillus thermoaerophilus]SDH62377.1 DNA methylase [Aneurinibacillus thermoaerophilus]